MRIYLALVLAMATAPLRAEEPAATELDAAIGGCVRAIAERAYDDYRKRNNVGEVSTEVREKAISAASSADGPIWALCACLMGEASKRWKLSELQEHQVEYQALVGELIKGGQCKLGT